MAHGPVHSRTIAIAGGGIGGIACALALARAGYRGLVLERAPRFAEVGAGLQLTPNATRALARLGVLDRVAAVATEPAGLVVRSGTSGREIVRVPFGAAVRRRFGRPWLVAHRADLLDALVGAALETQDVDLRLDTRVEDFALHARGVTVAATGAGGSLEETAVALIGADGLWSTVRARAGDAAGPVYRRRTAWRAMVPRAEAPDELAGAWNGLWLGPDAHLVHYPIRGGREINVVAIVRDDFTGETWSGEADTAVVRARFARWADLARSLVGRPTRWLKWALADRPPLPRWGSGAQTLVGDAAHPMLPFLAQGAALALEDAVVLAGEIGAARDGLVPALRAYEAKRRARAARVQHEARRNGTLYHLPGPAALARDLVLAARGGPALLERYAWIYGWRPEAV